MREAGGLPVNNKAAARAAVRAVECPKRIAACQAEGEHRAALAEAIRWLLAELASYERTSPRNAPGLYRQLTAQIAQIARQVSPKIGRK